MSRALQKVLILSLPVVLAACASSGHESRDERAADVPSAQERSQREDARSQRRSPELHIPQPDGALDQLRGQTGI